MESIRNLQWYMLYYLDNFKNFTCFTPFSMIGQQYPKSRKIWHLGKIIPWLVTQFWFSMMVAPLKTFQYFCHVPMFWLCHSRQSYPSSLSQTEMFCCLPVKEIIRYSKFPRNNDIITEWRFLLPRYKISTDILP